LWVPFTAGLWPLAPAAFAKARYGRQTKALIHGRI
jgi:hypothetical protein